MRCQSTRLASFLLRVFCVILLTTPVLGRAAPGRAQIPDQTAPLAASDALWDDRFTGPPGPDGPVTVIAVSGNEVFVGGAFDTVGKLQSGPVAHWSAVSNAWVAMGDGLRGCAPLPCSPADPEVYAIAARGLNGNDVYVGGRFAKAGAVAANHIAHWNGVAWSALGIGLDGPVQAIAIHGNDVYVGGAFQHAGGLTANGIARWDAATGAWSSLAGGFFNGDVSAIAVDASGVVYAGGLFATVYGTGAAVRNIAAWDGSAWRALGSGAAVGVDGRVTALAVDGANLYAGGAFTTAGAAAAAHVARWNAAGWSAVGTGTDGMVRTLTVAGGSLVAGGDFAAAGGVAVNRVARWTAVNGWLALGSGAGGGDPNSTVLALGSDGNQLYVGGRFDTAGGEPWNVNNVVRTGPAGSQWFPMGTTPAGGLNGPALALVRDPNSTDGVYAGGTFTRAGSAGANRVARWRESGGWTALGVGVDGPVYALATNENDVYVGGSFTTAGGAGARNIARWNAITQSWHPLGAGPTNGVAQGSVYAIVAAGEDVFVGGDFTVVDSIGGGTLALYHRTTNDWTRPAFSVLLGSYAGVVRALARDGDSLYIGGWFDQVCDANGCSPAAGVAACRISTGVCAALGSGIAGNDVVKALTVGPTGLLFVGGSFTAAGEINANGIARWDPQLHAWSALGPGIGGTNQVAAIAVDPGQYVYEGGLVLAPDNRRAAQPLVWNGLASGWSALGSGINGAGSKQIAALALPLPAGLYVAGDFTTAGGKASYYFARWSQPGAAETIPVSGGTLTSPADATSYAFAAGAFGAPAWVRHLVLDPTDAPPTGELGGIGHFFSLTAINRATGQPIAPARPYTVTVQYTAAQRAGVIEGTLGLYVWDGQHWLREATSQVNVGTQTVTAQPDHFSIWAVLGETRRIWLPLVLSRRPS